MDDKTYTRKSLPALIILISAFISLSALAQAVDTVPENLETLPEEIVITERYSRYQLRDFVIEAEEDMYNIFNELVDEKRFKIYCSTQDREFSRIKSRECKPEFAREATRAEAQEHLAVFRTFSMNPGELPSGTSQFSSAPSSHASILDQQRELQAKMEELARENPEFREALIRYVQARQRYFQNTQ